MLPGMSDVPDRSSAQKRRSFVILVVVLVVLAAGVTFALSRGGDDDASSSPTAAASPSTDQVTLATACAEIAPDMPNRVDALQRTAEAVRADIVDMRSQGNTSDAEQATLVAVALENMAEAQLTQQGVDRATRELGNTILSIC
jgi:flagellar basal body-associated protein FliL